jgi:threonylcarbamoyladenosine tRNA methylthiotransferase MtaB
VTLEVVSLGCRLNLSESESLRGILAASDNLTVINSCAVTAEAVRQTRQAIRRARRARPDARLLVTGCAAEVEREGIAAMPEVDGLVANTAKLDPRAYLLPGAGGDLARLQHEVSPSLLRPPPARGRNDVAFTRAFVDVQTGCDHSCTFCVIPQGRGSSRSRPVPAVLEDVARHLDGGARELVLTGVDLTSWGHDLPGEPRLGALVAAILAAFPAIQRLRLSTLDGVEIDPQLFELLAGEQRVMPHVHLSLQSGDDMILKRMKRRHSRADAVRLVERLRARRPEIAIGADLIAGFPTEDETMHANSLSIIAELDIVHGHVFPYSPRPGTPAARMPQVPPATIKARAADLRNAVARERGRWLQSLIGAPLRVLAERDGTGHADNFARVRLPEGSFAAHLLTITPRAVSDGMLV